jgi:hypothetical protein
LSASILFNNYSTTYLVNSVDLLDDSIFKRLGPENTIEAGISVLLVIKRGKHIFKKYLENRANLILSEIAVVKGFYINIVSEARLYTTRAWYNSFDYLFCFGSESSKGIIIKLICKFNLVFLEYKQLSNYLLVLNELRVSIILIFLTIDRKIRAGYY